MFASSLVVATKYDFTAPTSEENKKNIVSLVADKHTFSTIYAEVETFCCYN